MTARYANWRVNGYEREERDEVGNVTAKEVVVVIHDAGRWVWHVVLDKNGRIVDFRMLGALRPRLARTPVDEVALTHVPLADLERIAQTYLQRVRENYEDGHPLWLSLELSELEPQAVRRELDGMPSFEEFALAWREVGERTVTGVPRRQALAERYGVTVWAIDKWVKRIRDEQPTLIPPPNTGRSNRRRPQLPEA